LRIILTYSSRKEDTAQPEIDYLKGFIYEKRRIRKISLTQKITPKVSYTLEKAREYWRYAPTSIGITKTSTEELLDKPGDFIKKFVTRRKEQKNIDIEF